MYKNWNKYGTKRLVSSLILVGSGFCGCTEGGAAGIKARETLTRENLKKQPYKEIKVEGEISGITGILNTSGEKMTVLLSDDFSGITVTSYNRTGKAEATGIWNREGGVALQGGQAIPITVTAKGGTASYRDVSAEAVGVNGGVLGQRSKINVRAEAGESADFNSLAYAEAIGASYSVLGDECELNVTAQGGKIANFRTFVYGHSIGVHNSIVGDKAKITARAMGGDNAYANVRIISQVMGAKADGDGKSPNIFKGAAKIVVGSATSRPGEAFQAFSLYAQEKGTNDLSTTGYTHQIEGDIYCRDNGKNIVTLDTQESYLQGNLLNGKNKAYEDPVNIIKISKGGVWRPVYDNRYGSDCQPRMNKTTNIDANKVAIREASDVDSVTLLDGGVVDLTWDGWTDGVYDVTRSYRSKEYNGFRGLYIGNLQGKNGVFKVDADLAHGQADVLIVGKKSTASSLKVQVNYDNYYGMPASKVAALTGKALVVEDESGRLVVSGMRSEYNERTYDITVERDKEKKQKWNIVKIKDTTVSEPEPEPKPEPEPVYPEKCKTKPVRYITENTKHAADARANATNVWLLEASTLRERLGDLRSMEHERRLMSPKVLSPKVPGTNGDGVSPKVLSPKVPGTNGDARTGTSAAARTQYNNLWAKFGHGDQSMEVGRDTNLHYSKFQLGYDKAFPCTNGTFYRGVYASRINGSASYERGHGQTNSTAVGFYQTWLGRGGDYYDLVIKAGKISTDYNVTDLSDNYSTGDYATWTTTLSGEYGHRWLFGKGLYAEPSCELILGHIGSNSYTTSKKMPVYQDAVSHAIARVGFAIGKDFGGKKETGNIYFMGNYYHDFAGGGGGTTGSVRYETNHAKNWYALGFGGNVLLSDRCSAYVRVRKLFGNIKSSVQYNAGLRWKI
jgi:outer membrane autotransporter protein